MRRYFAPGHEYCSNFGGGSGVSCRCRLLGTPEKLKDCLVARSSRGGACFLMVDCSRSAILNTQRLLAVRRHDSVQVSITLCFGVVYVVVPSQADRSRLRCCLGRARTFGSAWVRGLFVLWFFVG